MDRKTILYRGSLKSCNYACSYCPFAKHPSSGREQEKDRQQWFRFVKSLKERAEIINPFALMVVPYGEVLLHPWYWEGLGELSTLTQAEALGAQTNLSFSLENALKSFEGAGGNKEKLRLWATFHPEMISTEEFAAKCQAVQEAGVSLCAGAVGVPENLPLLTKLRAVLPESIYLWVNRMDGLKRPYTQEEEQRFSAIDPFFYRELAVIHEQKENCRNRLFVEAGGRMHTCNISPPLPGNWYQEDALADGSFSFPDAKCGRKICSCYLAYGGREEMVNALLFGKYPLFRIPRRFSAAFLDIDGTLLREGEKKISPLTAVSLKALAARGTKLFFATSLPLPEAHRKCREIWPLFEGGVFAGGAHIVWQEKFVKKEAVYSLEEDVLTAAEAMKARFSFRLSVYRKQGVLYKLTLSHPRFAAEGQNEAEALCRSFPEALKPSVRFLLEKNSLQIIPAGRSKAGGMEEICQKLGLSLQEAAAIGDSAEDKRMMDLCGKH